MLLSTWLITFLASTAFAAPTKVAPRAACATGLHLIVARGTGADQATGGSTAQIYQGVIAQVSGSDVSQVVYPANSSYTVSCAIGVNNMRQQITNYAAQCPQSKIVLLGYSQGALVIGDLLTAADSLCKTGNGVCGNNQALDSKYLTKIASIVEVSDPAQQANAFFNSGSGASSPGRVPRSDVTAYNNYKGKIVEYCAAGDYWCASGNGNDAGSIHANACTTFKSSAISYIVAHK